jgi:hypothetical protein
MGHRAQGAFYITYYIVSCSFLCTVMKLWYRSWEGVCVWFWPPVTDGLL